MIKIQRLKPYKQLEALITDFVDELQTLFVQDMSGKKKKKLNSKQIAAAIAGYAPTRPAPDVKYNPRYDSKK